MLIAKNLNNGVVVADRVSVADTRATRAVGLLARRGLDAGEALWIVPSRGVHTCGMHFSIDLLALDESGTVIDRVVNMKPWRIRLPRRGTAGVLELPAGTLDGSGTRVGHRIELTTAINRSTVPDTQPPSGKREAGSGKREAGSGKREAGSGKLNALTFNKAR